MSVGDEKFVAQCLATVAVLLILIGIVSGTLIPHVVQVIPVLVTLGLVLLRPASGAYTAIPVFSFWAGTMVLIWFCLLGWYDLAEGHYSITEIILTFAIASCSLGGLPMCLRVGRTLSVWRRASLILGGFGFQLGFMVLSFQAPFANR